MSTVHDAHCTITVLGTTLLLATKAIVEVVVEFIIEDYFSVAGLLLPNVVFTSSELWVKAF